MRYTVKINRQASRDLTEIFQFIEDREQSPVPAEKFTNALVDVAMGLAQFPYRGHVIKRRPKARRGTAARRPSAAWEGHTSSAAGRRR